MSTAARRRLDLLRRYASNDVVARSRDSRQRRCLVWTPESPRQCGAPATHVQTDFSGLSWFTCAEHVNPAYTLETIEAFWERVDAGLCAELLGAP